MYGIYHQSLSWIPKKKLKYFIFCFIIIVVFSGNKEYDLYKTYTEWTIQFYFRIDIYIIYILNQICKTLFF